MNKVLQHRNRELIGWYAGATLMWAVMMSAGCDAHRQTQENKQGGPGKVVASPSDVSATPGAAPAAMIPFEGETFSPSLARLAEGEDYSGEHFAQQEVCAECHAQIASEWGDSMHAFASLSNAIYLESFKDFTLEKGEKNTRFCAGCHDPAMLFDAGVELSAARTDMAQAHQGVSCRSCHGLTEAVPQGNASYTISTRPLLMPDPDDADSIARHRAEVTTSSLDANALCSSCHRGVLTPTMGHDIVLPGLDELGPWRRSAFAGNRTWRIDSASVPREDCVSCHMPRTSSPKPHRSHRFAGGHSTFAAMIGAKEQLAVIEKNLDGAATLDIFALDRVPASAYSMQASKTSGKKALDVLGFDVVIFNERVGHAFPGGAKDLRDTWLEVIVRDESSGEVLASSGVEHASTASEPYTYVLHARLADVSGDMQPTHDVSHFRTPVYDHTIKPRDAAVVRYVFTLDERMVDAKLSISARLRHRRLTPGILERACAFSKSGEGSAYREAIQAHRGRSPDPCIEQPILEVESSRTIWEVVRAPTSGGLRLVAEGEVVNKAQAWTRWYRYGLGLLHHVQENLDEATEAFERAEALAASLGELEQAMSLQGLGMVAARQGRTKDAIDFFTRSDALLDSPHPSNAYHSGLAHMRVWKFEEAASAFERAADLGSANDARVLRQWAMALGSKSRYAEALDVAQRGLVTEPRDPHLLRSQMLALRQLEGVSEEAREEAARAYDVYKRDTAAPHVRDACSRKDPVCRAERVPIGLRWLRQPGSTR